MSENKTTLLSSLQYLDLKQNEAKVIIGMVKIGSYADASTIAKISNVPRPKVYPILQKLANENIIDSLVVEGGINHYKTPKIDIIINTLKKRNELKVNSALSFAEENLKSLNGSIEVETPDNLDFLVTKGKDRIIDQISDTLDKIGHGEQEIVMTIPISISRDLSKAIVQLLLDIKEKQSGKLNARILVNSQDYKVMQSLLDISSLRNNFLVIDFEHLKKTFEGQTPASRNSTPFILIEKFETFFASRPIFIVAGTEAAFIVIGENNMMISVKIQRSEFISFQQRFLSNLFELIQSFVSGISFQN